MPRERSMTSREKGLRASVVMGRGLNTWAPASCRLLPAQGRWGPPILSYALPTHPHPHPSRALETRMLPVLLPPLPSRRGGDPEGASLGGRA